MPPPLSTPRRVATLSHEESVQRTPYEPRAWLAYAQHLKETDAPAASRFCVYERAVAALPGSYKLWRNYAIIATELAHEYHPEHPSRQAALDISARSVRALPRAPRLALEHVRRLCDARRWTAARLAVNAALRALPVTQHALVWDCVRACFVIQRSPPPLTRVVLLTRFATHTPNVAPELVFDALLDARLYHRAVSHLATALSDPNFQPADTTRHHLWLRLARHAAEHVTSATLDIPRLMRGALREDRVLAGEIWLALASYFSRKALFEDAADTYEDALTSVTVVRDFALVFDAYATFLEALVTAEMDGDPDLLELRMARLEHLSDRRPMLLSDVMLRQNPHNVHEWHKRARMFKAARHPAHVVDTYTKALQTVDPWRATNGRPHTLWLAFASYYEAADDLISARRVLDKAVDNPDAFHSPEDLAAVWCEYAEMELRRTTPEIARQVLLRATKVPDKVRQKEARKRRGETNSNAAALSVVGGGAGRAVVSHQYDKSSPAWNAYKSHRVWHFLIDLTHSIASPDDVSELHQRMLELRIASPQTILSGAAYLESRRLFEQAFRLYDKGASSLPWPDALQVWVVYLKKFVKRFGARKLERARNVFEEVIRIAPTSKRGGVVYPNPHLRLLYLMYADTEEQYSLPRKALQIFARAVKEIRDEDRPDMYRLYIVKLTTMYGVTKTRPVYEEALSSLTRPEDVLDFGVRYAEMEVRLGEIDRARAIFKQTCQIADPRKRGIFEVFWSSWNDFELTNGTEDTFRDMLREQRDVGLHHKSLMIDTDLHAIQNEEVDAHSVATTEPDDAKDGNEGSLQETDMDGKISNVEGTVAGRGEKSDDTVQTEENAEEIGISLSDDDDDNENISNDAGDANETAKPSKSATGEAMTDGSIANSSDAKMKIAQKELPLGVRNLVAAAHAAKDLKRKREQGGETGSGDDDQMGAIEGEEKPMGALERFKRRR